MGTKGVRLTNDSRDRDSRHSSFAVFGFDYVIRSQSRALWDFLMTDDLESSGSNRLGLPAVIKFQTSTIQRKMNDEKDHEADLDDELKWNS